MKKIEFTQPLFKVEAVQIRNNREALISDIVDKTDAKDKKYLARRIAITANQLKWSDTDLHSLLHKYGEVKNYSAFVNYCLKVKSVV